MREDTPHALVELDTQVWPARTVLLATLTIQIAFVMLPTLMKMMLV